MRGFPRHSRHRGIGLCPSDAKSRLSHLSRTARIRLRCQHLHLARFPLLIYRISSVSPKSQTLGRRAFIHCLALNRCAT